jgi:hypothetical protein
LDPGRAEGAARCLSHVDDSGSAAFPGIRSATGSTTAWASLAKLEARVAWDELLQRIPDYQIAEEPHHFTSSTFYGWEALHITF